LPQRGFRQQQPPAQHPSLQQPAQQAAQPQASPQQPEVRFFLRKLKIVNPDPPSAQGQTTLGTQIFSHSTHQQCFSTFTRWTLATQPSQHESQHESQQPPSQQPASQPQFGWQQHSGSHAQPGSQ